MNPLGYVNEIRSIEKEEKRLRARAKRLREQKKKAKYHLYHYMENRGLEKYEGVTKKSIKPKPKAPRKKAKQKKKDAIELFYRTGIPDPEGFWNDFQKTQKVIQNESNTLSPSNIP